MLIIPARRGNHPRSDASRSRALFNEILRSGAEVQLHTFGNSLFANIAPLFFCIEVSTFLVLIPISPIIATFDLSISSQERNNS